VRLVRFGALIVRLASRGPGSPTPTLRIWLAPGSIAATAFWEESTATYRKVCTVWVTSAKQVSTRDRRMTQLIECCAAGELVPSQRYGEAPRWLERAAAAAAAAPGVADVVVSPPAPESPGDRHAGEQERHHAWGAPPQSGSTGVGRRVQRPSVT
jgi:hypothetical protein